jgi:ribosomal-protein-alanine N-acetyltransferase
MSAVLKEQPLLFRPMRDADLLAIASIERASYLAPWSYNTFADCLRVGYCCWVLQSGAQVGGYGIMTVCMSEAHILNICIRDELRSRGHGRALLRHLLDLARAHNASDVYLEVRPSNAVALKLYDSMGFKTIGARRGYYPAVSGREDALVLTCSLPESEVRCRTADLG